MVNVVLAGGGTAGHVNPLLATASALLAIDPHINVTAVGTAEGLENALVPAAGVRLELVEKAPFPRSLSLQSLKFPVNYARSIKQAQEILRESEANVVIGFGGYASTPIYRAAKKLGLPTIVHEGNARPGMANKLGARDADVVALTFPSTPLRAKNGKTVTVGLPLRKEIGTLATSDRGVSRLEAAADLGLNPDLPTIVVTGGSLGAQRLNESMSEAAATLGDVQILHITGKGKDQPVRATTVNLPNYYVLDYLNGMERAYAVADLVITRAGAGMVAETSALGIPAIFVPLPIGNGEQALNAHDVVEAGGALLVDNSEFTPGWITAHLPHILDPEILATMSAKARGVSPMDAAQQLAQLALDTAKEA